MNPLIKVKTPNLTRLKHFWALWLVLFLFADPRVLAQDESSVTEFEELEGRAHCGTRRIDSDITRDP